MRPVDVNPSMYIDFSKENNKEGPEFKVGHHVKISKYKNIFAKCYVPDLSEKVYVIKKESKILFRGHNFISDCKSKEIVGKFYGKELQESKSKRV